MTWNSLLFYGSLFGLGALDSLEPGHGKALVLGFFTGDRAKAWHIAFLGVIVTLTHIAINGLLAALILYFAAPILDNDQLFRVVELLSGLGILVFAGYLAYERFYQNKTTCCGHTHSEHSADAQPMSLRQVTVLGVLSGLAPCPIVLTALVSAILIGKGSQAWQGIAAFSLGYGTVIMATGWLTLFGVSWLRKTRWSQPQHIEALSRWSVVAASSLGLFFIIKALWFPGSESTEAPLLFYRTS